MIQVGINGDLKSAKLSENNCLAQAEQDSDNITERQRELMIDWLILVCKELVGSPEAQIIFKSAQILDYYLLQRSVTGRPLHNKCLHVVGVASLLISAKLDSKAHAINIANLNEEACHSKIS